jgi:hypothetical protein
VNLLSQIQVAEAVAEYNKCKNCILIKMHTEIIIRNIIKPIFYGALASVILLGIYFSVLSFISGRVFALEQFLQFWYFVVSLAVGFGIQVGLYVYLKSMIHKVASSSKVVAVSGATSTGAMISCCAHYLVNILPALGVTGLITVISQYQVEFFWIGITFNIVGIVYVTRNVIIFNRI